jgi:hypothetical protein
LAYKTKAFGNLGDDNKLEKYGALWGEHPMSVVHRPKAETGTRLAGWMVMQTTVLSPIEKLVELYYLPLFNLAMRLYGNPAKAMVLTQRTFRLAFDFSRTFPVPTNVRAWLFAILFNKFMEGIPRVQRA